MRHRPGTFSIAAFDPETDSFGAAVTTGTVAVGATCPYVSSEAAVLTQSFTKTEHGRDAVERAAEGERLDLVCEELLDDDEYASYRQVHGVGRDSHFTFTGADCVGWHGSVTGEHHTVAGNMLAGPEVVEAVSETYESTDGDLTGRLVAALEAGEEAGGDERGELSAAVLVHAPESTLYHNLRVDFSETPIADLRDVLSEAREAQAKLTDEVDETLESYPEEILNFGVKY